MTLDNIISELNTITSDKIETLVKIIEQLPKNDFYKIFDYLNNVILPTDDNVYVILIFRELIKTRKTDMDSYISSKKEIIEIEDEISSEEERMVFLESINETLLLLEIHPQVLQQLEEYIENPVNVLDTIKYYLENNITLTEEDTMLLIQIQSTTLDFLGNNTDPDQE